ncbi:MAG: hypothetical protein EA360_01855 [Balneolaceae bacterium]|nr:MAG: hypothetical protein EA360_01855 [Balneolaceae bacterium]
MLLYNLKLFKDKISAEAAATHINMGYLYFDWTFGEIYQGYHLKIYATGRDQISVGSYKIN